MRPEQGTLISRAQAMSALLELLTDQPVIVCNGFPSREVQKIADRPTHFYMIGSMGNAPAIALGIALAKPHKHVVTFDGDGNVLMGLGTLATVGALRPKNFVHVIFDNEVYGTTGNQPTISNVVPLDKVAKAAGYVNVERALDRDDRRTTVAVRNRGEVEGVLTLYEDRALVGVGCHDASRHGGIGHRPSRGVTADRKSCRTA